MIDNLMDYYMSYKTSRLKKYGLVIMHSHDEFLEKTLVRYIKTYINCYYYNIFDTVNVSFCDDSVIRKELEGKRLEMLDELLIYELIDSNEIYELKQQYINDSYEVVLFLITLDRMRFLNKEIIPQQLEQLLYYCPNIKASLGTRVSRLETLIKETYVTLNKFLDRTDDYYVLDYQLYKDRGDLVKVVMLSNITMLQDNYKRSLLERVYREDKLKKDKFDLLIKKFIKQFIIDSYNDKRIYDKYFIEIDDYLFSNKKDIDTFLGMLDNPFLKRYLVIVVSHNNYISCQSLFRKYKFSLACIQDFSHINDVNNKLTSLDMSNIYKYIIVSNYKSKDLDDIVKYGCVNLESVLFSKEG